MNDSSKSPPKHHNVIFVRATREQKQQIYERAAASELSASRYLVQSALMEKPPTAEERRRLEKLLYLFRTATLTLRQLLANAHALRMAGADSGMVEQLEETALLLSGITEELRRRV